MIDFVLYHTLILPPTCVSYNMSTNKKHKWKATLTCLHYQFDHQSNNARIRNLRVPLTSLLLYKCEWNLFWCKCLLGMYLSVLLEERAIHQPIWICSPLLSSCYCRSSFGKRWIRPISTFLFVVGWFQPSLQFYIL